MTRGQAASVDANDLPSLPPDWRYEPVSSLGQPDEQAVLTGPFGTNLGRGDFVERGVPVLTIGCLTEGGINLDKALYVSEEKARELERYQLREGDLLFSRMASVGRAGIVPKSLAGALFNYHIMRLRLDESRIDPRAFINYVRGAKEVRDYLKAVNHGATRDGINTEQLLGLPVAVPPPAVQREMVAEFEKQFSRLDEAVAKLKRVKANLKRYKAAVLKAAVEGRLVSDGGITDAEARDEQVPSAQSGLPPRWRWYTVGEVARVGTGATPSRSKDAYWIDGDIPWVTSAAVNEPYVDAATEFVTRAALAETNLTLYPPGTLLVAMYGEGKTRGKCTELRIAATTNQALAALQVAEGLRPYLKLFLDHSYVDMRKVASGGVQPNLNLGLVRALRVPLPPGDEQQRIVAEVDRRLSIVREVEAEVDANLKRAQALRQAILQDAFGNRKDGLD